MEELAMHIMDILQNSIKARSSCICVEISVDENNRFLDIVIRDDGCGMDAETLKNAMDPFYTSRNTRNVGLGLPLFEEAALMAGGDFNIESEPEKGTVIHASFEVNSIDRQPLGNIGNIFFLNMISYENLEFKLQLHSKLCNFSFGSREFSAAFFDDYGSEAGPMEAAFEAEEYINKHLLLVFGGILPEMGGSPHETKGDCQNS